MGKFQLSGMQYLYIDAVVNTWVITWCCFDVYLLIGAAATPADVLMNALGLVFLYNLDDVGGDLGFVNEDDWPGRRFAWIHANLVDKDIAGREMEIWGFGGHVVRVIHDAMAAFLSCLAVVLPL